MFDIKQRGSTVLREVLGGSTTFLAMSYIIFVQVFFLSKTGMDGGGVMVATCLSAALASILMGFWANYPIALAPGMGENTFFAFTLAPALGAWGVGVGWEMALGLTLVSGLVFLGLSFIGFRSAVLNSLPDSLKSGIAAGIGMLVAVAGFSFSNLVVSGGALVKFNSLDGNPVAWLSLFGLAATLVLMALHIRGALLLGIVITTVAAIVTGQLQWCGNPVDMPRGLEETAGGAFSGISSLWTAVCGGHVIDVIVFGFVLLFMDLFDTVGTLVGVASRSGLMSNGKLPKAERALASDAVGTVIGAGLGTSTVTSYIESIAGVSAGARTGLAAIVTGVLFIVAMFFQPLIGMVGGGIGEKNPMIAPALILVGAIMLRSIRQVNWDDVTEYVPAFLTMVFMPLTFSISAGIAIGFVSYAIGKLVSGRARECSPLVYIFAVLFILRYVISPKL